MNLKLGISSFSTSDLLNVYKITTNIVYHYIIYHYKSPHSHLCEASIILVIVQGNNGVRRLRHHLSNFNWMSTVCGWIRHNLFIQGTSFGIGSTCVPYKQFLFWVHEIPSIFHVISLLHKAHLYFSSQHLGGRVRQISVDLRPTCTMEQVILNVQIAWNSYFSIGT